MTIPRIGVVAGAAALTLIIFLIDLAVPLGVAGGVPYVVVVMMGLWLPKRRHVVILATVSSFATLLGFLLSPAGGIEWMVVANRGLALFAIWVCALILTMRKETQYELIVENRRADNYLDISEAIIVHLDPHFRIRRINSHGCNLLGYQEHELVGRSWLDFCLTEDRHKDRTACNVEVVSCLYCRFQCFENEIISKDGDRRNIAWKTKDEFDRLGRLVGTLAAGHDVTDLKRVENRLRLAHEEMEERVKERTTELEIAREHAQAANRSKTEILNITSHELRTPLNAIIGFSGMMTNQVFGALENKKYREYAEDIHQSGQFLLEVINDILDVGKIEADEISLDIEAFDIVAVLESCMHLIENKADQAGIQLNARYSKNLPPMKGDRRRVKQIIINLLTNAVKFTPRGGRITLFCDSTDDGVRIAVSDTGIGIPEDKLQSVFQSFYKVKHAYINTHQGIGLGLPIVKSLVEMHGGNVELTSKEGSGTTITVSFPPDDTIAASLRSA